MDEERVEYNILSAVQHRKFYDFYRKICLSLSPKKRNTAIGRELR